jgi:hypothetical protein
MSEADHEARLRQQMSADAAAGETERAVFDSTSSAGTTPGSEPKYQTPLDVDLGEPVPAEPALPGARVSTVSPSRTPQLLAGGGLVAVVLFVLWRLKLRRTPPTPSERLAESARAVGTASVAAGTRAVGKLSDNAGPAAERAAELAKRGVQTSTVTARRAATAAKPAVAAAAAVAAREGVKGVKVGSKAGSKAVSKAVENSGDLAAKAGDVAARAGGVAAQAGQSVTSTLSDVTESIGDAGHSVHKSYRKWTFRLWFSTFAAIGYVLGARAGRERYDQIVGLAGRVTQQAPVQQAKSKVSGAL